MIRSTSEICFEANWACNPPPPLQPEGDDVRLQAWVKPGSWWSDPSPHTCWCHLLQNPHLDAEVWNARTLWNNWKTLEVQIMTAEVALNSRQPRNLYQKIGSLNRVAKCHIFYTGNKDCHEFRFSIVRIVINVSNATSIWDCLCYCPCHFFVFLFVFVIVLLLVMSRHHSDQMSQGSQVSRVSLWTCSLNVFVIVIVFVFVFVFFLIRLCILITLIKCLKGHKSLGSLFAGVL